MKSMKVSCSSFRPHIPSTTLLDSSIIPKGWADWFYIITNVLSFVQDTVHVAVKLKSRLLKPQIVLPMGNFFASNNHLHVQNATLMSSSVS